MLILNNLYRAIMFDFHRSSHNYCDGFFKPYTGNRCSSAVNSVC